MTEQLSPKAIVVFDIDGVIRDVSGSYRRAIADTVEHFTEGAYRPTQLDIDRLKSEGVWNNDWEASQELTYRYFETLCYTREQLQLDYNAIVTFFQSRYRGCDPDKFTGYICNEPLLLDSKYLEELTKAEIPWGFFSGATRGSATYILEQRLGLKSPVLIAMEDAPSKPNPTGLFATVRSLESSENKNDKHLTPVVYVGDTVADMYTVKQARLQEPSRTWIGVGVLPPHVQQILAHRDAYAEKLIDAGASMVFTNVQHLSLLRISELVNETGFEQV
ncbi:TIGR01548 family HAD-type hydrolase [Brasilonema octagenarum UFV-E1]|uniref:TIGR01548 family HAD-type hydrolase n=1 Tax=Brasilonema sennae CENA114 TaxID=415709 RepID=A0A856M870_9CYAN|nr:TIGR01548 family HAD-type hydrolase [Brasilonema sennae]QDL06584.1 TIGR01548 family HAD-type hydrolase [Brasilonema sennae CENA114]QDL12954.1 TIGR01548 family HAD-type hydrolase [Brasilonema octagenarum UFV-E1]